MKLPGPLGGSPLAVIVFVAWVAGVVLLETVQPDQVDRGLVEKISGSAALMIMLLMKDRRDEKAAEEVKKAATTAAEETATARKELRANTLLTKDVKRAVDDLAAN